MAWALGLGLVVAALAALLRHRAAAPRPAPRGGFFSMAPPTIMQGGRARHAAPTDAEMADFMSRARELTDRARRGDASAEELTRAADDAGMLGAAPVQHVLAMYAERLRRGPYPPALAPQVDRALSTAPPSVDQLSALAVALDAAFWGGTASVVRDIAARTS